MAGISTRPYSLAHSSGEAHEHITLCSLPAHPGKAKRPASIASTSSVTTTITASQALFTATAATARAASLERSARLPARLPVLPPAQGLGS